MSAWKRYIVHLVAGIFLFPVLYQPVHIVRHHGHEHSNHAHEHDQHHACEHGHHHDDQKASDGIQISTTQDDCLVCEYEFVIKDLPGPPVLVNVPARYFEESFAPALFYIQTPTFSLVNPRAPPQA